MQCSLLIRFCTHSICTCMCGCPVVGIHPCQLQRKTHFLFPHFAQGEHWGVVKIRLCEKWLSCSVSNGGSSYTIQQFATQRALSPLALAQHKWDETMQVRRRKNLSALTGSGWCCSKRLRLAVEAASGSALTWPPAKMTGVEAGFGR